MAEAAIRLLTTKLPMLSAAPTASPDQRCDFISPAPSRRSNSLCTISSSNSKSSSTGSSPVSEETELQSWTYSRRQGRTAHDEVERKKSELRVRKAKEAEGLWREFWH